MKHVKLISQTPVCAQTPTIDLQMIIEVIGALAIVVTELMGFIQSMVGAFSDLAGTLKGATNS